MRQIYELTRITTKSGRRFYFIDNKRVPELIYNRIDCGWLSCACMSTHYNRSRSRVDCKCIETTKTV